MLTVIIPILNAMPYLTEALASLERQSFRDFEVCLWDNGSTDGSVEEARRWIPGRLKGRVVTANPLPLHACLSRMVDEAQTEFVARMDGDDVCLPERFKKQMAAMRDDAGLVALGGQMELIGERGQKIGEMADYPTDFCGVLSRMLFQCPLSHPAVLLRREKVLEAGNYQVPKPMEDFDLWFRLAGVGEMRNLPEKALKYRIIDSSITNQAKSEGTHAEAVRGCLRKNLEARYGISPSVFDLHWAKRHPVAFLPMLRAARSISDLSGVDLRAVLARPEFLFSARCYTARWDVLSKLVYRIWGQSRKHEANGK
jgi:glycosyltransferase involved in cell wall biosynthesis